MVKARGRTIFLFGTGGTVDWSATASNDPGAAVSVTPGSGTLTKDRPIATMTVTASAFVSCASSSYPTITISPGGTQYSVCTGWIKPAPPHGHGHGGGHGGGGGGGHGR